MLISGYQSLRTVILNTEHSLLSVSYTHLDVYKRQTQRHYKLRNIKCGERFKIGRYLLPLEMLLTTTFGGREQFGLKHESNMNVEYSFKFF